MVKRETERLWDNCFKVPILVVAIRCFAQPTKQNNCPESLLPNASWALHIEIQLRLFSFSIS
ncbi:hypothetical protein FIU87_07755 [Bacillus sp. THAF10]|nr:hypothetical protein FIU87_07755 [Bacillus sp. THAF10]